jgi:hypothetical protein
MLALLLVSLSGVDGDRPVNWNQLRCPGSTADASCEYTNPSSSNAMAISFFFQADESAKGRASFSCKEAGAEHYKRSWSEPEWGSAGACFFILGAGSKYSCSGQGVVNIIGAHSVALAGKVLDPATPTFSDIPCPSTKDSSCSYNNTKQDMWVQLGFITKKANVAASTSSSISCSHNSNSELCFFSSDTVGDEGSCSFILPKGASLRCKTEGGVEVSSAKARPFAQALVTDTSERVSNSISAPAPACPIKSVPNSTLVLVVYSKHESKHR